MLSRPGRLFHFGCYLYRPLLVLYYEDWLYQVKAPHWTSEVDAAVRWLMEEEVFFARHERLNRDLKDQCLCMAAESEKTGGSLAECFADKLRAAAHEFEAAYARQGETLGYMLYCLFVAGVGERFDWLMSTPALDGSEYQAQYRAGEAYLCAVHDAALGSVQGLRDEVDEEGWRRVVWRADTLVAEWLVRVQLATDGVATSEQVGMWKADGVGSGWQMGWRAEGWTAPGWRQMVRW